MNTEKQRAFIIHFVYSCLILALLYLFLRYVMYTIMPFLIGFLIAFMLRPLIKRLTALSGGHEKLWSSIVILVFYATIGAFGFCGRHTKTVSAKSGAVSQRYAGKCGKCMEGGGYHRCAGHPVLSGRPAGFFIQYHILPVQASGIPVHRLCVLPSQSAYRLLLRHHILLFL